MIIDNIEQIKSLLTFDNEDDFYFSQVIQRKKENPQVGSNSHVCKTYYIRSREDLDYYRGEMICLAHFHNARVGINLNRRSFEKIAFQTLRKVADQIMNKDYKQARKAYNSVCGLHSLEEDKKWIIDVDRGYDELHIKWIGEKLKEIPPVGDKILTVLMTKHGYHINHFPF